VSTARSRFRAGRALEHAGPRRRPEPRPAEVRRASWTAARAPVRSGRAQYDIGQGERWPSEGEPGRRVSEGQEREIDAKREQGEGLPTSCSLGCFAFCRSACTSARLCSTSDRPSSPTANRAHSRPSASSGTRRASSSGSSPSRSETVASEPSEYATGRLRWMRVWCGETVVSGKGIEGAERRSESVRRCDASSPAARGARADG
jgi:hypothetical protein